TPIGKGFSSINVQLRRHFDLYANVRPAVTFPGTRSRYDNIDIITVRENTEGAYLAEGQTLSEDGETAQSMVRNTRTGASRIVRYAFELAVQKGRRKVTAVHKANIIKTASALFLDVAAGANIGKDAAIFEAVHGSAPDIAGKGVANPCALLLAAAQMLDHADMVDKGERLRKAVRATIEAGDRTTPDLGGSGTTEG